MSIDVAAWTREDGKVFLVHNPILKKWFFANMLVTLDRQGPHSEHWFPSLESKHHVDSMLGLAMIENIVAF